MELKILKRQYNSSDCIVCGLENKHSLQAEFYELENNIVYTEFYTLNEHQSFPGRTHGGVITAILDEVIGRAVQIGNPSQWAVTGEITVKFLKPTPLDAKLKGFGKLTRENSRMFSGVGFIEDENGDVLATASAKYFKLELATITDGMNDETWFFDNSPLPQSTTTNNLELFDRLEQRSK